MKRILILNGHPDKESYCQALASAYQNGAERSKADCRLVHLSELKFDPILHYGYKKRTELEPDLLEIQEEILAADHLVFVYPTWWGTYPALLKGFIDRVFLPKFAFHFRKDSVLWDKLLKGRSARLIVTMNTPAWYYTLILGAPGHNSMRKGILGFCGVKPVKITTLRPIKSSSESKRKKWLGQIEKLGYKQK